MLPLTTLLALVLIAGDDPKPPALAPGATEATCELSLAEAIRMGLDNSATVRVLEVGASDLRGDGGGERFGNLLTGAQRPPSQFNGSFRSLPGDRLLGDATPTPTHGPHDAEVVIARTDSATSVWRFKADVTARLQAIEQAYWALWVEQTIQASWATTLEAGEALLRRKPVATEDRQPLERFQVSRARATAERASAERQLRATLGLTDPDDRPIRLTSAPVEAKVEPDWTTIRDQMLALHPEIALERERLATADLQAALGDGPVSATVRSLEPLRQLLQDVTRTLSQADQEVATRFTKLQAAQAQAAATRARLDTQRADDDGARVPVIRLLDVLSQQADAVSQEARSRANYHTALIALQVAKGTLLAFEGVSIAASPSPRRVDHQQGHGQFHVPLDATYRHLAN